MTDLLRDVETPSDAELISRVRGGDVAAYGELFARHKDAATRLARQLVLLQPLQQQVVIVEALSAACWSARAWLARDGLTEGASADLLVLDGDPLEDLRVLQAPSAVVLRGVRWS